MAPSTSLYPRATVKRIVKAHSNRGVSKNVDILVCLPMPKSDVNMTDKGYQIFLDYAIFLQEWVSLR